ncbi:T-protein [bacterium HR34]|nr:T-protein [bacterium HR34]
MENSSFKIIRKKIKNLRNDVDKIDKNILNLLAFRFKITEKIGKVKKEVGLPLRDKKRESEKIKNLRRLAKKKKLNADFVEKLFKKIFDEVVKTNKKNLKIKE